MVRRLGPPLHWRWISGFSLVELLVVVAIMAVLATAGLPLAEMSHRRNQEEELRRALRELRGALDAYKRMVDTGFIVGQAGGSGYPPRLQLLVDGVDNARSPAASRIYFLRRLPRDPFAPDDGTDAADSWGLRSYESPADDPRAGADVFDIYSRSSKVGLNGVPYRRW